MNIGKIIADMLLIGGVVVTIVNAPAPKEQAENVSGGAAVNVAECVKDDEPETMAVPYGDTSFKSYMDYRAITNKESPQWLLEKKCKTDGKGLRRYGDDYVIAVGSFYSKHIGERLRITLDTGESFTAVVGDFKADCHTDGTNRYTMAGESKNVIEFIVDTKCLDRKAKLMGDISYITGMSGNIRSIEKHYDRP